MQSEEKVVHYYHANADAFGGRLERPFEEVLPVLAPSSLPVVGGYHSARHEDFRLGELFSIKTAYTQVAGSRSPRTGSFNTIVTSVIEGLNVGNVVFADRVAVQISTAHPAVGYHPKVSFIGTEFRGLRIGGCKLEPTLNLGVCDDGDPRKYPTRSCFYNEQLRAFARQQSEDLLEFSDGQLKEPEQHFKWLEAHTNGGPNTPDRIAERGNILCSMVEKIEVVDDANCPGTTAGHVIDIPEFGVIYLAELIVDHGSFDLTMLRFELGCPATAKAGGPHGGANGTTTGGG
jgi:hypothetical protein